MWPCSAPPTDRWSTFSMRADDMWLLTCNQICRWGLKGMILLISTCLMVHFSCWRPLVTSSTQIFRTVGRLINPSSLNQRLTHVFLWMLPTFPAFPLINTPRQIFIRRGEMTGRARHVCLPLSPICVCLLAVGTGSLNGRNNKKIAAGGSRPQASFCLYPFLLDKQYSYSATVFSNPWIPGTICLEGSLSILTSCSMNIHAPVVKGWSTFVLWKYLP